MPTESSHDAIILRPDLSTSHEELENWYQALAAAERGWSWGKYSAVSDYTGVFCFCAILCRGEIINGDVHGISDWGSQHDRYKS